MRASTRVRRLTKLRARIRRASVVGRWGAFRGRSRRPRATCPGVRDARRPAACALDRATIGHGTSAPTHTVVDFDGLGRTDLDGLGIFFHILPGPREPEQAGARSRGSLVVQPVAGIVWEDFQLHAN